MLFVLFCFLEEDSIGVYCVCSLLLSYFPRPPRVHHRCTESTSAEQGSGFYCLARKKTEMVSNKHGFKSFKNGLGIIVNEGQFLN